MLDRVHQHILEELRQSSRTDTIFIVTAVIFDFVVLGANSLVADHGKDGSAAADVVLVALVLLDVLVNLFALIALNTGGRTRATLLEGLVEMYRDHDVDRYYDPALLGNYGRRYMLFSGVLLALALAATAIPCIVRLV